MTKYKKIALLTILSLFLIISIPNSYAATTHDVHDESELMTALSSLGDDDTIMLLNDITLTSGYIPTTIIKDNIKIISNPTNNKIDANGEDNIFVIDPLVTVEIEGIIFTGATDSAIYNKGILTLTGCTFENNKADHGGAIYNDRGTLTLNDCEFFENEATYNGGAICSIGDFNSNGCIFKGNTANEGGAIYVEAGFPLVTPSFIVGCTFLENKAGNWGAAIRSLAPLYVMNSVFYETANFYVDVQDHSGTSTHLVDNFYFWVNPTPYDLLKVTNTPNGVEGYYYLEITPDSTVSGIAVPSVGDKLDVTSKLKYGGPNPITGNPSIPLPASDLPDLDINVKYNGKDFGTYKYKDDTLISIIVDSSSSPVEFFYEEALINHPLIYSLPAGPPVKPTTTITTPTTTSVKPTTTPTISGNYNYVGVVSLLNVSLKVAKGRGYVAGEKDTISWNTSGISSFNRIAHIVYKEKGKVCHEVNVPFYKGSYTHTFIRNHKSLDTYLYFDASNGIRFPEIRNMSKKLTVSKKGKINIVVRDYNDKIIEKGKVNLTFDKKWSFTVNIVNGVAKFSHDFVKSGNRILNVIYMNNDKNTASSMTTEVVVSKNKKLKK